MRNHVLYRRLLATCLALLAISNANAQTCSAAQQATVDFQSKPWTNSLTYSADFGSGSSAFHVDGTIADPSNERVNGYPATQTSGGQANTMVLQVDRANVMTQTTVLFKFNVPLSNVSLTLTDIDYFSTSGGKYNDQVSVVGKNSSGATVTPTGVGSTYVDVSGNTAFANASATNSTNCDDSSIRCNATFTFPSEITEVTITYANTTTNGWASGNPPAQEIGLKFGTFCVTALNPQLKLVKSGPTSFTEGALGQYALTVTNIGQKATSGDITLVDQLPVGMTYVSSPTPTVTGGTLVSTNYNSTTRQVTIIVRPTGGTLAVNGSPLTVNFTVQLTAVVANTSVTNYAAVMGGGDPDTTVTPGSSCSSDQCSSVTTFVALAAGPPVSPGIWSNSACLDFAGMPALSVNSASVTRSFTTPEGVVVTYTLDVTSNAKYATGGTISNYDSETVLLPYRPGSYSGDRWDDYFGSNKWNAVYNQPVGRKVGYTLSAYATYNGQAVPFTLLTGSAEDDGTNEYVKITTNGTAFSVADRQTGKDRYGDVTVTNSGKTVEMSVNSVTSNFLLVATTKLDASASSPLVLTNELAGNGATAQGFCLFFPFDRGDNPTSYGKAAHLQTLTFTSPLSNVAKSSLNTSSFAPSPFTTSTTSYLNGQPNSEAAERGTTATEDADDALNSIPTLKLGGTTYALTFPYTSSAPATVAGWVDFNGNGTFDAAERATTSVTTGSGTATLTWTGINITAPGTTTYARIRISSNSAEASSSTGNSILGEVEDYLIPIVRTSDITIIKDAQPNSAQDFTFSVTDAAGTSTTFALDDDGDATLSNTITFDKLAPGQYVLTEQVHSDWTLTAINCTPTAGAITDLANRRVTITLTAGTPVSCTFVNTVRPPVIPTMQKYVRNVTAGSAYGTSSTGAPGEIVQYCIAFRNTGGPALNFKLLDNIPTSTSYVAGSAYYATPAAPLTGTTDPARATLSVNWAIREVTSAGVVTSLELTTNADGRTTNPTGLPADSSGFLCFQARIK